MKPELTLEKLKQAVMPFCADLQQSLIPELYGITDGKAVGTYIEHRFRDMLLASYTLAASSSAFGLDFPSLELDLKSHIAQTTAIVITFRAASQNRVSSIDYGVR